MCIHKGLQTPIELESGRFANDVINMSQGFLERKSVIIPPVLVIWRIFFGSKKRFMKKFNQYNKSNTLKTLHFKKILTRNNL